MRLIEAEPAIIRDLMEESDLVGEKSLSGTSIFLVRHPTLGKLVLIKAADGQGMVVEID